jgi:hypothetical protein
MPVNKQVDGDFLRGKMPNKEVAKKTKAIDVITEDCNRVMQRRAEDGQFKCRTFTYWSNLLGTYRIKEIYPGLPTIHDTLPLLKELFKRLIKRDGVKCYAHDDQTLVITWAPIKE